MISSTNKTLVILHLYYADMWPYFEKKLQTIGAYDLIVTIPKNKRSETPAEIVTRPFTEIVYMKNRGRDIRPFLSAASKVDISKYQAILKLHTKRSPHYKNGQKWLDEMVESLTSISETARERAFTKDVAMIGPKGHYYSLRVNFEANGVQIDRIMRRFTGRQRQQNITQVNRSKYGFFGGSMFWISPSYLGRLLRVLPFQYWRFERERGQEDGTYAHAIERVFSLVAEADNIELYEASSEGDIKKVDYSSGQIPQWSDHFTK